MEKNLVISTVKREAHITVVEVNTTLVAKLMEIQCTYKFDPGEASNMAILLVKDLAENLDVLSDEFFAELVRQEMIHVDSISADEPSMPEPVHHDF